MRKKITYLQKAEDFKVFQGGDSERVLILQAYGVIWHYFKDEWYKPLAPPSLPEKITIQVDEYTIDNKKHKIEIIYWYGFEVFRTSNDWGKQDPVWLSVFSEFLEKADSEEELRKIIDAIHINMKKYGIKEKINLLKEFWS